MTSLSVKGEFYGSYAGSGLLAYTLRAGNKFTKNKKYCSPINNTRVSLSDSVLAYVKILILTINFNSMHYEREFKILSLLDDREHGIYIGLPDIK